MPITPHNLVRHELIGLKVKVKDSTDPAHKKISGKVVYETYNMLKIETRKKEKSVPKSNSVFVFTLPDSTQVEVDGKLLVGRPEERIKKKLPKW